MSEPEIRAEVRLLTTAEGGRMGPTPHSRFGCPLRLGDEYFDCRLLLEDTGPLAPGQTAVVPIAFLSPALVMHLLAPGAAFTLWEGKTIGTGRVLEILR